MTFKMKSSMAKLTNSPAKQDSVPYLAPKDISGMGDGTNVYDDRNKNRFTHSDSLDIYRKQTELNVLADKINKHVNDYSQTIVDSNEDSVVARQRSYPNIPDKLKEYHKLKEEHKDLKYKYFKEYQDKENRRNAAGHAENPFMLEEGHPGFYESDDDVVAGNQTPWGANKYKTIKPTTSGNIYNENSRDRVKQQKIAIMKSKNLEFIPIEQQEFKLETAGLTYDNEKYTYSKRYDVKRKEYVVDQYEKKKINGVYSSSGRGKLVNTDPLSMYKKNKKNGI